MLNVPNHQRPHQAPRESELGPETRRNFTAEGRAIIAAEIARYLDYCQRTETPWFPVGRQAGPDSEIEG